jgi:hypothetical protein
MSEDKPVAQPILKIVNPDATPEEVAAIVAVLSALGGGGEPPRRPRSTWSDPSRRMHGLMSPGSGAWRASALPR